MVYLKDWEDFEIAAESMFMQSPGKCRFTLKYIHSKGLIQLKFTDNIKVSSNFYLSHGDISIFILIKTQLIFICSVFNIKQR